MLHTKKRRVPGFVKQCRHGFSNLRFVASDSGRSRGTTWLHIEAGLRAIVLLHGKGNCDAEQSQSVERQRKGTRRSYVGVMVFKVKGKMKTPTQVNEEFRERMCAVVAHVRKTRHLCNAEIARELNIAQGTLTHFVAGKRGMSVNIIIRILMKYSELSPAWLMLGEGNMVRW